MIRFPINLYRLIDHVRNQFTVQSLITTNLNPLYILEKLESLEKKLESKNGTYLFIILINEYLSPKRVIKEYKLNKIAFDYLIEHILLNFNNSKIDVSEMVGPIAAQSRTCLQYLTFHFIVSSNLVKI